MELSVIINDFGKGNKLYEYAICDRQHDVFATKDRNKIKQVMKDYRIVKTVFCQKYQWNFIKCFKLKKIKRGINNKNTKKR